MFGNSITVLNKSGKVVSNSKHLTGVWKEAKAAYQTRKAEIRAERTGEHRHGDSQRAVRHGMRHLSLSDDEHAARKPASRAGSSRSVTHSRSGHRRRASVQHGESHKRSHHHEPHKSRDSQRREHHTAPRPRARPHGLQRAYTESAYDNETSYKHPDEPPIFVRPDHQLARRNTTPPRRPTSFDEDLAYGALPPPLPINNNTEIELKGKMTVLNRMLEEANCLQYSATSMIEHLQRNPEALAAVGLTLAEISTLARKVGPVVLANMKTMFPAAIALLASPQFLIAGGVAVGVTVVMLGGYKIIKRAKAQKALEASVDDVDELREIEGELSGIELWRRGIADVHEESIGTSVDGEFITPDAAQRQISDGIMRESDLKPKVHRAKSERSHRSHRSAATSRRHGDDDHDARSQRSTGSRRRHGSHDHGRTRARAEDEISQTSSKKESTARKAVGGIKMLFKGKSTPNLR